MINWRQLFVKYQFFSIKAESEGVIIEDYKEEFTDKEWEALDIVFKEIKEL